MNDPPAVAAAAATDADPQHNRQKTYLLKKKNNKELMLLFPAEESAVSVQDQVNQLPLTFSVFNEKFKGSTENPERFVRI